MNRDRHGGINEEIEAFRRALVSYAKACEWDTFEKKAGILFDNLESIELSVLQKKFFRIFLGILAVTVAAVVSLIPLKRGAFPPLLKYKDAVMLFTAAASCFELFFFLNFRAYVKAKMAWYRKSREQFIRNIRADFAKLFGAPFCDRQGLARGTI